MEEKTYWQSGVRLPKLARLSKNIEVDVVIIGAGLTGITAAYLLKKEGAKVALIDRERCAAADTAHTTAHLTYVTDTRLNKLVKTFGKEGAKAFWEAGIAAIDNIYDIARKESPGCDFKWVAGYLHTPWESDDARTRKSLERDAELAKEFGFNTSFVENVPFANACGVRFENQAKFQPLDYLAPLLRKIPGQGSYLNRKNPWFELFAVNRRKFHGGTWRYLKENLDFPYYMVRDRLAKAEGTSLSSLKRGQGKILKLDGKKVAAYRDEYGKVILRSPICTHLGCIVHWNNADKKWDCPCHGSRFHPSGQVYAGPAESPLAKSPAVKK